MEISLIQLELQTQLLLELFSKRPIPKLAWITFAELTKTTQSGSRNYYSYFEQWIQAFPEELTDEDIAGIDPNSWLYLYDEWVVKASSRWIDVPNSIKQLLEKAKDKAFQWMDAHYAVPQRAGVWIPVVEQIYHYDTDGSFGRLRNLQLVLNQTDLATEDRLVMERAEGNSPEDDAILGIIGKAAKQWMKSNYGKQPIIDGLIRYQERSGVQTGFSMALGAASLTATRLLQQAFLQDRYLIKNQTVAFTGSLAEDGKVLSVDEAGLRVKVKTCFFSWITFLVVPAQQVSIAEQTLEELKEQWPGKSFRIIGVNYLEDVFVNRYVCNYSRDTKAVYIAKKAWRNKNSWVGWASLFVLVMVIWRVWYGPLDKNPHVAVIEGSFLKIKNKNGLIIRTFEYETSYLMAASPNSICSIQDINKDGSNEIILIIEKDNTNEYYYPNQIQIYDRNNEHPIWTYNAHLDVTYPNKIGFQGTLNFYNALEVGFENGKPIIYVSVGSSSFSSAVQKIDIEAKQIVQQYVHPGGINAIRLSDINGDKKNELVISGANNALYAGMFAILDPENMDGNGLTDLDYISDYAGKANELAYIKIKDSKFSQKITSVKYPWIKLANITQNPSVLISMNSFELDNDHARFSYLVFELNQQLEIVHFNTSDVWDVNVKRAYDDGKIDKMPDKVYWEEYIKNNIQYWNGKSWQSEPTWANYEE